MYYGGFSFFFTYIASAFCALSLFCRNILGDLPSGCVYYGRGTHHRFYVEVFRRGLLLYCPLSNVAGVRLM